MVFVIQIMMTTIVLSVILLFGSIIFLVLSHVCIVGRVWRRGFSAASDMGSNGSNSMSIDDLQKLPSFEFKAGDTIDCAVCLESFKLGDKCRLLPICKHSFHAQCVNSWLLKMPICPICRTHVRPDSSTLQVTSASPLAV